MGETTLLWPTVLLIGQHERTLGDEGYEYPRDKEARAIQLALEQVEV